MGLAVSNLPLHGGKAPPWLFRRMVALSDHIVGLMALELGTSETVRRMGDPYWFQCLSCVLGFDWHSSGTTTVTMGALKEALDPGRHGIAVCGGKGRSSRKVASELGGMVEGGAMKDGLDLELASVSRLAAKVDSALVQDGYGLYQHSMVVDGTGNWAVIQQGMNAGAGMARRYQWCSADLKGYFDEPHTGILCPGAAGSALNMAATASAGNRKVSVDLVRDMAGLKGDIAAALAASKGNTTLFNFDRPPERLRGLDMPLHIDWNLMRALYDFQPRNYEELVRFRGVGPATVRALALVSELIYGSPASWKDPMKYTFTVGGKDGVPYPVDRKVMDRTTAIMAQGVREAGLGSGETARALRRLGSVIPPEIRGSMGHF